MINILKANELPPGARIMGRQGRALNGLELAAGLVAMIQGKVGSEAAAEAQLDLDRQWWTGLHLTFPRAMVEWVDSPWLDGSPGIWLRCILGTGKIWTFQHNDENADIRNLQKLGPFGTPDDMRDALGLPRIAQFKLPSGEVVTAELPGQHLRTREPKREEILAQIAEVPQLIAKPDSSEIVEKLTKDLDNYMVKVVDNAESLPDTDLKTVRKEANEAVDRLQTKAKVKEIVNNMVDQVAKTSGGFVADFSARFDTPKEELLAEPPVVDTAPPPAKPIAAPAKAGLRKAAVKGGRK